MKTYPTAFGITQMKEPPQALTTAVYGPYTVICSAGAVVDYSMNNLLIDVSQCRVGPAYPYVHVVCDANHNPGLIRVIGWGECLSPKSFPSPSSA